MRRAFVACADWAGGRLSWRRKAPSSSRYFIGEARQYRLLYTADVGAHQKSSARNVPRLERLYDIVASVRSTFGEFPAYACDCTTQLDLQREPRQRLDQRGVAGLLGDGLVKFPIAHGICFN